MPNKNNALSDQNQARQLIHLQRENAQLKHENAELRKEIVKLKEQLNSLMEQLKKDSHNSSKPPSSDGLKKRTKSLRGSSGKKPGGQKGHVGHTLKMVEEPDKIVTHKVNNCEKCGLSLDSAKTVNVECRQVFDIPKREMEVTEHQAEMKSCPGCGFLNKAPFPADASNITQYGRSTNALATYFSMYQLIPLKRVGEIFSDLFNSPISKATIINMIKKTYESLKPFEVIAKKKIINSPVVHADESGFYCENKRQWLHCASTQTITHYQFHAKRGKIAMDEIGILPNFRGTLVHDFWSPYLKYSCSHSLCNAHHLREFIFLIEEKKSTWASEMKKLLLDIKEIVDKTRLHSQRLCDSVIKSLEKSYDQIVEQGMKANPPPDTSGLPVKKGPKKKSKSLNLLLRFKKHKEKVLAFMYNFNIPFDNNLGERDIRMIKLQQKISGTFRSKKGAYYFCRIRSYISTVKKNHINVLTAIQDALNGLAFIPKE